MRTGTSRARAQEFPSRAMPTYFLECHARARVYRHARAQHGTPNIVACTILDTSVQIETVAQLLTQKPRIANFPRISSQIRLFTSLKRSPIVKMLKALTQIQKDVVRARLMTRTPHAEIANEAHCSIPQIKRMSQFMNRFGDVDPPKFTKRGPPFSLTLQMIQVPSRTNILMFERNLYF